MSKGTNGPWQVHTTQTCFENPWVTVETSDVTHPDGSAGTYGVVRFAHIATGVFPVDIDGHTWLVGQHRFPFNAYSWELPEGGGAKDVDPQTSAARELTEETGLIAQNYLPLGRWQLSNSVTDEVAFGFLAWGLKEGDASPDPSEALTVTKVPVRELVHRVRSGQISDAFTVLMVYSALDMAHSGQLPPHLSQLLLAG
ncbi:MAG: NUDIX hydrolase [Pseudomonadota bacterium]